MRRKETCLYCEERTTVHAAWGLSTVFAILGSIVLISGITVMLLSVGAGALAFILFAAFIVFMVLAALGTKKGEVVCNECGRKWVPRGKKR